MKRVGGLFHAIADRENLAAAAWRAGRGKRTRDGVRQFFGDFSAQLGSMHAQVASGSWLPDDAPSCSRPAVGLDEASGKPSAGVDIQCGQPPERTQENTSAGAPLREPEAP